MNRGLTLFEVLVGIAILGLIAVIVLPTGTQSRSVARRASCANSLSQIGKALILYSEVPSNTSFPTNKPTGRGDPLPSLGILYRDYVSDSRVFSCAGKSTLTALRTLGPTVGLAPSSAPLDATMTHFGYDPGNQGTNYRPHTPNDAMAIVVADFTAAGKNSDNHGPAVGQNCLRASGSVEWFEDRVNLLASGPNGDSKIQDSDITTDGTFSDPKLATLKSYISQ